jgi:hypothetical protein
MIVTIPTALTVLATLAVIFIVGYLLDRNA